MLSDADNLIFPQKKPARRPPVVKNGAERFSCTPSVISKERFDFDRLLNVFVAN